MSPTFSGLRIADGERVPEPLRGRVIPWMQVHWLRGFEAQFTDEDGNVIVHAGRRVTGTFDSERQREVARRLLERVIRQRLQSRNLRLEYHRRPDSPWTIVLGSLLLPLMMLPLAIMGCVRLAEYFRDIEAFEPGSVRLMMVVMGVAAAIIWPALLVAFIVHAIKEDRIRPLRLQATESRLAATLPGERVIDCRWFDLQRIDSGYLTFNDGRRVCLPGDARFIALKAVLRRDLLRAPDPSLVCTWWLMVAASGVVYPLAMIPILVLAQAGYLDRADTIRMTLGLTLMTGMVLIPSSLMLLVVARTRAKTRRDR